MPRILSTHPLHPRASAMLAGAGRLVVASALDGRTLAAEAKDADIVIVRAPLPAELFDGAAKLRAAIRHGAGLDMIPVEAATAAGVLVANVPAVNARSVAEHVMFVTLALLRRFRMVDRDLRAKGWLAGRDHANANTELAGKTIGIVGLGAVGQAVGHIAAHGFDLNVVATTRSMRPAPDKVGFLSIDALVEQSDIVVLCCPLTPETRGLISRERISRMKPNALLINVSRGPVVDDDALIEALRKGSIGGAALDVFATQPLPPNHPYFGFDNVIVTPHMAGITEESMMRMGVGAAGEALQVLANKLPVNLRNPEVTAHYRRRFPVDL
ncbi:hydroxyacid dehydrogenase [Mesorhizobium sp. M4B.F.Ca.ET.169.01.1.1]|uniref:hydroxyacid dehydrogenase n=1 Tax=unclassified Mesorhizobium TaxID=325217 RepID=UPI000FD29AAB|nr:MULTISPECIES: hydroxyacid dehydrogenase [unclassified Mesorhizobium]RUW20042.1 hydroxyacid dehydrogenase [Mesorhizobium sp. M4B.F.Ca.ET.013.02.1.1]RWF65667.1 MAG: hydroxyacid dehydrogenase [Mesorhizobium sp.]TGQ41841.1 hydroxyacid dehydrogenase [Mesorhizobium sp. M4B.F.Ca.ET.214.01.1.1]TGQ61767.1 hydroxyacid dehydrogenase [Mesorhizobium sp. M4B.F.Ca.ET.211.01.1.1]TGR11801.1 hydroxyacid dehydrogenase [Mesorhizobium sp. M4B.F.Ca.ET.200.01.1.1]